MPEIIAPPKTLQVTFSLEPTLNVVYSLELLNIAEQFSGLSEWVYQTAAALSPEQLRANRLVGILEIGARLDQETWPDITTWLDELAAEDPGERRDRVLDVFLKRAQQTLGDDVPTAEQLLADRAAYLALVERMCSAENKDEPCDLELYQEVHALLNNPSAMHSLVVTHLRTVWDQFLAPEWERTLPMLQESVSAFQTIDFAGMSCAEIVRRVTGRELATDCERWQKEFAQIMFIPSAHIGPYVGPVFHGKVVKLVFGARVPAGVAAASPGLSRSELLMRLSALADETRLRILELLAGEDALSSPEIMERLDLSQSAASRHLRQLAATGYLSVERREGAKFYRLNRERIDDTFGALKKLVK